MPTFRVTIEGSIYKVKAPEGTTRQQAYGYAAEQHVQTPKSDVPGKNNSPVYNDQSTLFDKAVGVGEAGLTALSTIPAGIAGIGGGLYSAATNGKFGTQAGVQESGNLAADVAADFTYQPRTEKGRQYTEAMANALQNSGVQGLTPGMIPSSPLMAGNGGRILPSAAQRNASKILREHLPDASGDAAASARQAAAREAGVSLIGPEAYPANLPIQKLATHVQASPTGGQILTDAVADRPAEIKGAAGRELHKYGRNVGEQRAADAAQEAATQVLKNAAEQRSELSGPFYEAAKKETLTPQQIRPVAQALGNSLNGTVSHIPEVKTALKKLQQELIDSGRNVAALDKTRSNWLEKISPKTLGQDPNITKAVAAAIKPILMELDSTLLANSPTIAAGRQVHRAISEGFVNPLEKGPVGRIAGISGADAQLAAKADQIISEMGGKGVSRAEIRQIFERLNEVDPTAATNLSRAWMERTLSDASKRVQGADNMKMGANIKNAFEGTPEKAQQTRTMIEEMARTQGVNPAQAFEGWKRMMNAFDDTGKVPGIGSPTSARTVLNEQAGKMSVLPAKLAEAKAIFKDWIRRGAYREIAAAMTAPDAPAAMRALANSARYKPNLGPLADIILRQNQDSVFTAGMATGNYRGNEKESADSVPQ